MRTVAPSRSRARLAPAGRRDEVERPTLGAAQPGAGVLAERRPVVAALLEDDQPPPERGDPPADLVVDGGRQGEVADRVVAVGVEAERDDDDRARRRRDRLERPVEDLEVAGVVDAGLERQVEVRAGARSLAGLVGPSEEVRVLPVGIGVDRDVQHVAATPEDLLGAIAVVDSRGRGSRPARRSGATIVLGRDRGVVEEAVAGVHRAGGMVAGRPAQPVGRGLAAVEDEVDRRSGRCRPRPRAATYVPATSGVDESRPQKPARPAIAVGSRMNRSDSGPKPSYRPPTEYVSGMSAPRSIPSRRAAARPPRGSARARDRGRRGSGRGRARSGRRARTRRRPSGPPGSVRPARGPRWPGSTGP